MRNATFAAILPILLTFAGFLSTAPGAQAFQNTANAADKVPTSEPGITKEQAAKIIQELQMIRMLLESQVEKRSAVASAETPPQANAAAAPEMLRTLSGLGNHLLGDDKAPVTLVEFLDLQCPFCMEFQKTEYPEIKRKYVDTGMLRFVVFDFPLPSHAYALPAAEFAECAGEQGKYWQVQDAFLSRPQVATPEVIHQIASANHLDKAKLNACMQKRGALDEINRDVGLGRHIGIRGTPSFLLGRSLGDGVAGEIIEGAPSLAALEAKIDASLSEKAPASAKTAQ